MKIVILTQYFPPEVGAPQNRLFELAVRLKRAGDEVTILTAMPNYPSMEIHETYKGKFYSYEEMEGLKVHRSYIFVSKSKSILKRLMNYYSFVISSFLMGCFKLKEHNYIICESPPLFLGKTGWLLSVIHRSRFIFNVSDLWPESAEKLGLVSNKTVLKLSTRMEEFFYKKSFLVTGQTQGIVSNIKNRFPDKKVYWLPNGVDLDIFKAEKNDSWKRQNGFLENDFIFLYAGIIGHAQGLEVILKCAELTLSHFNIKYLLLGSGPEKEKLQALQQSKQLSNVFFLDAVSKMEMKDVLASVDATIIPLRKLDLFLGAIPSKIFENLAMKVPVILGVDGEARELFVNQGNCALYFEPENEQLLSEAVLKVFFDPDLRKRLADNGIRYVAEKFERNQIARDFRNQLVE